MSIPQSPTPPEPARPEDHQELVTFLERIFRPERMGSMAAEYPHLYAPELMPWNLVSRHCGRIVSVVGAFPIAFYIQSARPSMVLTVGGVGGVSTCPAHRGRGLMQAGLHTAIARMRDHEYAFSMLWGDRQRYAHFGYEDAGTELRGRAQRRQFPIGSGVPLDDWRPADPDSPEDMIRLADLDAGRSVCPYRTPERWSILLRRLGFSAYLASAEATSPHQAFLIGGRDPRNRFRPRIAELGGNPVLWPSMVSAWLFENSLEEADVFLQPDDRINATPLTDRLQQLGLYPTAMLKLLNLHRTLEPYLGILEERAQAHSFQDLPPVGIVPLESPEDAVTIQLSNGAAGLTRGVAEASVCVQLPERQLVRWLFGPIPPLGFTGQLCRENPGAAPWQLLLPLPFPVPQLNRV